MVRAAAIAALFAPALLRAADQAPIEAARPALPPVPTSPVSATPAIHWRVSDARQLLDAIDRAGSEGLDPADYDRAGLNASIAAGDGPALDTIATTAALRLARDYFLGRVQDRTRFDWKIERSPYATFALPAQLAQAVAGGTTGAWLRGLLPQDARYAALRAAYAEAPAGKSAARDRLRANLERLRWLPRDLGADYVYVNLPSYRLAVVEGGAAVSYYNVIVGAPDTPTPMLSLTARSVVVNPSWSVPQSIVRKKGGANFSAARGYVVSRTEDGGYSVRQKPGPMNSLGRLKIDMPNPDAIYLHDTHARGLFARDQRALSHGCVRVKDIDALAEQLMGDPDDATPIETALATNDTQTLALKKQWPVYIVYLTADIDADGKIVSYGDPYMRDAPLLAALDRGGEQLAAN